MTPTDPNTGRPEIGVLMPDDIDLYGAIAEAAAACRAATAIIGFFNSDALGFAPLTTIADAERAATSLLIALREHRHGAARNDWRKR